MRKGTPTSTGGAALLLAVLLAGPLAGCLGDETAGPAAPGVDSDDTDVRAPDGRDLRTELTESDALPAPVWQVGDWWGIHVYFGSQGGDGSHINVIVTDVTPDTYTVATDTQEIAKQDAVFDIPILGAIARPDLGMTGLGGAWDWFRFPLTDGATWQGEIPNIAFDVLPDGQVPLTFTATFEPGLDVEGQKLPGYRVEGRTEDGTLVVEYDFAPAVRWFTRAVVYDIDPEQDPIELSIALMGYGRAWTGTYYVDTANVLLDHFDGSGFDAPPPDGRPFASPAPATRFTVSADATYLYGFVQNVAVAGARATILVQPDGTHRPYHAAGAPEAASGVVIDEAAQAGEWTLLTAGAGGLSIGYAFLAEVIEQAGTL